MIDESHSTDAGRPLNNVDTDSGQQVKANITHIGNDGDSRDRLFYSWKSRRHQTCRLEMHGIELVVLIDTVMIIYSWLGYWAKITIEMVCGSRGCVQFFFDRVATTAGAGQAMMVTWGSGPRATMSGTGDYVRVSSIHLMCLPIHWSDDIVTQLESIQNLFFPLGN